MMPRLLLAIALIASTLVAQPAPASESSPQCGPLPAATGDVVTVSTVSALQAAVDGLVSGRTILIADGTYALTNTLNVRGVTDVAIRSASGDRDAVVLDGRGMSNAAYGNVPHVMAIYDAQRVLIADLTLRDAYFHNIQLHGEDDADDVTMRNLHVLDAGEQLIKGSSGGDPGPYSDGGIVECSLLEYTDRARSWYTNAVDVLAGADWIVRDNVIRNIRAPEGELAGPAVLFWRNSLNTIVERNLFIENDRAIALGLSAPDANSRDGETTYDHQDGIVRNNMIYREGGGDIAISANYSRNVEIAHNTVIQNGTFAFGTIEYRFGSTSGSIVNNLTDGQIWQRDGATATLGGNVTTASPGWFVDAAAGDLHLLATATGAIDQASGSAVTDDYDTEGRPAGPAADVGADEFGGMPGASGFLDVPAGHTFDTEIAWLVDQGITLGCNSAGTLFCPDDSVTRAQMATFLDRALAFDSASANYFTDDDGSTHEAAINRAALAGVTAGCDVTGTLYCPSADVTRAQMASFLARALALTPVPDHGFVDVSGTHAANIGAIATAGITLGCDATGPRYCPSDPVTRAQMAAFLYRALAS
jgi:hypothetical protein